MREKDKPKLHTNRHRLLHRLYQRGGSQQFSVPLLFLIFQSNLGVSLERLALLVTVNFMTQLAVDLVSAKLIDRVGYRRCVTFAHLLTAVGLLSLSVLPSLLPDPYAGLICSVVLYAAGSGLIEVLVSPIIEACPAPNKHSLMSLMHSFYCFGTVAVVLISTLALRIFGSGELARDRRYMGAAPGSGMRCFSRAFRYTA